MFQDPGHVLEQDCHQATKDLPTEDSTNNSRAKQDLLVDCCDVATCEIKLTYVYELGSVTCSWTNLAMYRGRAPM